MAKLAVVTEMRKMTPGDKDTVIAGVFVLAMLLAQVTLVVLARFIARAVAGGPKEVEEPVSAQVAGLAWMMSAGITHPEKAEEEEDQDDIHTPVKIRPEDEAPDSPLGPPPTPFSPSGRQSVFYSKLTTHEHQRLREFRALLNKSAREDPTLLSTPALKRFANDATLCRYLRARDWNLKRAMKMLKASLQWRKAARPEFITWDDVKKEGEEGKQYLSGRDRHGRAVLIARPGRDGGREQASHVRFLIYTLEHATWSDTAEDDLPLGAHAEHTSEKLVVLINFTGWTLATAPPMKTARETLAILQEHHPERLAVAVCYNPPWIFAVFWKAISPFIDPNTYRKIRFVNPKREKEVRRMRQMFDMSCVDEDLGGDRSNVFDARAFGDKMRVFDARKAAVLKAKARR
uniref:CRAL-TRIO domain-containing protein n=1 Tax=Micromonas pusilla TaxID=38833 RepID=A0A7S0ILM5_MICPS